MKEGERAYWTPAREKALLKLGKKAESCSNGVYKDWSLARELLPKVSQLLEERTNEQLRKTYSRIVKSSQGICAYGSCSNVLSSKHRYCEEHRAYMSERASKHVSRKRAKLKEVSK